MYFAFTSSPPSTVALLNNFRFLSITKFCCSVIAFFATTQFFPRPSVKQFWLIFKSISLPGHPMLLPVMEQMTPLAECREIFWTVVGAVVIEVRDR